MTVALVIQEVLASCPSSTLAVYSLQLVTHWTEENFPKQYPQWRPPAQWSKTVGFTHTDQFQLYKMGAQVGEGVRQFVETGSADSLEKEAASWTFLDSVLAPPILQGGGREDTTLFLDGNHSQVSVVTKIVPSPDWFIGLSSIELCRNGHFIDRYEEEAFPLDAGTDNGFTFTSPNWETEPRGEVFRMTNTFPAHPAGSFHYPHLPRLPRMAVYTLQKMREYKLSSDGGSEDTMKYRYTVDADILQQRNVTDVLEFIPVDAVSKIEDPGQKENPQEKEREENIKTETIKKTNLPDTKQDRTDNPSVVEPDTKLDSTHEPERKEKTDAKLATVFLANPETGNKVGLDFIPVSLTPDGLSARLNNTRKLSEILSNAIPGLDLFSGDHNMLSNTSDKFLSFVPVKVTTRRRNGKNRNKPRKMKEASEKDNKLMKLLIAVEDMSPKERRATIIKRNREKRRRQKQRREKQREKRFREKTQGIASQSTGVYASNSQKNFLKKKYYSSSPQPLLPLSLAPEKKNSLYSAILASYNTGKSAKEPRKMRRIRHKRRPRNCKVAEWSHWGDCNKSCGIGESVRTRQITQRPLRGGQPCPRLTDYKWCGSARTCNSGYFKW